ncbi:MAG: sialate O-acetylesterase [Phycisphaerae bacterium]|nr:sialate O-acetylesterase [Phycisphaerae bacterium]
MSLEVNVVIDSGPGDWQIVQQVGGAADIPLAGRWQTVTSETWASHIVLARLVKEETGVLLTPWTAMKTAADGTWRGVLRCVPAGGLYRLETMLVPKPHVQWGAIGQARHHLGVGDLWIIAGQSNSAGYGQGPVWDPPENGVHLFNNAMRWGQACHPLNESTHTAHAANREWTNPMHSPWLHWARRVKQEIGWPIGLIQTSLGGSPLVSWNPTEPGEHALFDAMVQAVRAAGGAARGMLWYQGCSDANPVAGKTYLKRFTSAVKAWRKALKNPRLFVLTVQINRAYAPPSAEGDLGWSTVREAQRQAARTIEHCCVIPTIDLPLSDVVHNSAHGNLVIAERSALAALGAAYGKPTAWQAPEIASAQVSRDGMSVALAFDHVTNALYRCDEQTIPFAVTDAQGPVPITKLDITPPNVVQLTLGRKLQAPATLDGAPGINPPRALHDWGRFQSMLAFAKFPIAPAAKKKRS